MDAILKMPDVTKVTGLSRTQLLKMVKDGEFPKPVRLSVRSVGWRSSDVNTWLSELKAA